MSQELRQSKSDALEHKKKWQSPKLVKVGAVDQIVQAMDGKSGTNIDASGRPKPGGG